MQKIRITFDGFWETFNSLDNFVTKALKKNFDVEILPPGVHDVDAVFYSIYATEYLNYDCIRIYYTGENLVPDFNLCDYAIGFGSLSLGDRFFRYPVSHADFHDDCILMERKNEDLPENPAGRKFCAMVVSNSIHADPFRENFFHVLSAYKRVDSGGRYLNNIGKASGVKDKNAFLRQYKFSLAFENVSHPGYCTEKLPQSFAAGTVPIYWGDPEVAKYYNPRAFVNLHDYSGTEEAIEAIRELDSDDSLYLKMLHETALSDKSFSCKKLDEDFESWLCHIFALPPEMRGRRSLYGFVRLYENDCKKLIAVLKDERSGGQEEPCKCKSCLIRKISRKIKYALTHSPQETLSKIRCKLGVKI